MAHSQMPVSGAAFNAKLTAAAWRDKPSYAIVATQDRALNPELARWMAKRAGSKVTVLKASHRRPHLPSPRRRPRDRDSRARRQISAVNCRCSTLLSHSRCGVRRHSQVAERTVHRCKSEGTTTPDARCPSSPSEAPEGKPKRLDHRKARRLLLGRSFAPRQYGLPCPGSFATTECDSTSS